MGWPTRVREHEVVGCGEAVAAEGAGEDVGNLGHHRHRAALAALGRPDPFHVVGGLDNPEAVGGEVHVADAEAEDLTEPRSCST